MRLLRTFYVPHWRWFAGGTAFAVVTSLAASSYGYFLKLIIEGLEAARAGEAALVPTYLWWLIGLVGGAAILRSIALYAMTILNNTGVQNAIVDVQDAQFVSLTTGDFSRVSDTASGSYVSRFINDVNALRDSGLRLSNNLTKGVVTVVACLIIMLVMDWKLTLVLLALYPVAFGPVVALGQRVRKRSKAAQKQIGEVTSLLSEGFQSSRIVKAYGLEEYQAKRANIGFVERSRLFLKVLKDRAAVDPILEITGGLVLVCILAITAWRIVSGDTSLGNFVGVITTIAVASPELRALGTLNAVAQEGAAAADRVYDILDTAPRVADVPGADVLQTEQAAITFDDVTFSYPDGSPALKGLSFEAAPGETVALVGPSGAGKSTVFNLLMRLYDTQGGAVFINAADVRDVTAASLRLSMALVAQDAALFDDTIGANIALGKFGAAAEDIQAAAEAANAHDFIMELPGEYAAPCGEMGRNLSGGQRQRVALARAILRRAPILLLDEATSALDAESEAKVQTALADFSKGRTTLVIAHRLSTVRAADKIVVIEDGRAVEEGSHDELMDKGGVYAKLAELQLN